MKNKEEKYLVLYQEEGNLRYMEITESDADKAEELNGTFYRQADPEEVAEFTGYEIHEIREYSGTGKRPDTWFKLRKKIQSGYVYRNLLINHDGYWIEIE